MPFKVVAPCVLAKDQGGHVHHRYEGDQIAWLSAEQAKHFLDEKLVEEVGNPDDSGAAEDGEKPAKNATKPVLIKWIVDSVAKDDGSDYTAEELDEWKVPELRSLIDSVE